MITQERADRSIQEPGETQFFLNLPELGIVPAGNMARSAGSHPLCQWNCRRTEQSDHSVRRDPAGGRSPEPRGALDVAA